MSNLGMTHIQYQGETLPLVLGKFHSYSNLKCSRMRRYWSEWIRNAPDPIQGVMIRGRGREGKGEGEGEGEGEGIPKKNHEIRND